MAILRSTNKFDYAVSACPVNVDGGTRHGKHCMYKNVGMAALIRHQRPYFMIGGKRQAANFIFDY